jgi:hypothetical protein
MHTIVSFQGSCLVGGWPVLAAGCWRKYPSRTGHWPRQNMHTDYTHDASRSAPAGTSLPCCHAALLSFSIWRMRHAQPAQYVVMAVDCPYATQVPRRATHRCRGGRLRQELSYSVLVWQQSSWSIFLRVPAEGQIRGTMDRTPGCACILPAECA